MFDQIDWTKAFMLITLIVVCMLMVIRKRRRQSEKEAKIKRGQEICAGEARSILEKLTKMSWPELLELEGRHWHRSRNPFGSCLVENERYVETGCKDELTAAGAIGGEACWREVVSGEVKRRLDLLGEQNEWGIMLVYAKQYNLGMAWQKLSTSSEGRQILQAELQSDVRTHRQAAHRALYHR